MKFKAISILVAILVALFIIFVMLQDLAGKKKLIINNDSGVETDQTLRSAETKPISSSVIAPQGVISIEVADTPLSQEQGLGGRDFLAQNSGMLFPFSKPGMYSFWMKDMRFSIDMIWIGEDKTVLGVEADVSPSTYPNSFMPPSPVMYVLEVNGGVAARLGISKGVKLGF